MEVLSCLSAPGSYFRDWFFGCPDRAAFSLPATIRSFESGVLRIVCDDGGEEMKWAVTLTSPTTAEIVPGGADAPKMEPIRAEKAH